jgi:hypothetical protein
MRQKKPFLGLVAVLVLSLVVTSPAAAAPPESGTVTRVHGSGSIDCTESVTLTHVVDGWVNVRSLARHTVVTYHLTNTYSNDSGQTWVHQDTGSVRIFPRGGHDYVTVAGHTGGWDGQDAYHGRRVLKDGDEITVVGSNQGLVEDRACAALAS